MRCHARQRSASLSCIKRARATQKRTFLDFKDMLYQLAWAIIFKPEKSLMAITRWRQLQRCIIDEYAAASLFGTLVSTKGLQRRCISVHAASRVARAGQDWRNKKTNKQDNTQSSVVVPPTEVVLACRIIYLQRLAKP